MEELVKIVNNVGFPIAMCVYTLFILKGTLDQVLIQLKELGDKQQRALESITKLIDYVLEDRIAKKKE